MFKIIRVMLVLLGVALFLTGISIIAKDAGKARQGIKNHLIQRGMR